MINLTDVTMHVRDGYRPDRNSPFWWLAVGLISASLLTSVSGCDTDGPMDEVIRAVDASQVKIYRDSTGVPHAHGETDAAAAFGFAYAQAEDNFAQVEENYIRAIGRAAELFGSTQLVQDWLSRSLKIEELSIQEFRQSPIALQDLLTGYAAGLNHYVTSQQTDPRRLLQQFEPWHPLALIRYLYYQNGFLRQSGISRAAINAAFLDAGGSLGLSETDWTDSQDPLYFPRSEQGSNSWAVTDSKSASGSAMLFINPHLPYFGPPQVYEGHVISDSGWNFTGYTRFGFPFPYVGFNEHLGWASTDNAADQADAFAVELIDEIAGSYRFGDETRQLSVYQDTLFVGQDQAREAVPVTLRESIHGPIIGRGGSSLLAVRMARFDEPGWLDQWYAMTKATSFEAFRKATSRLDMLFGNYLYADKAGTIQYVYNAAVPRRSAAQNFRGVSDGANSELLWDSYHDIEELPQLMNPIAEWLQNCNQSPFFSTTDENPDARDFPIYMVSESDNARSRNARRILASVESFSFDQWELHSLDTYMVTAEDIVPQLVRGFDDLPANSPVRTTDVSAAIDFLRSWDYRSSIESVATTLFIGWYERGAAGPRGLQSVLQDLTERFGSWQVGWGDVNRLQRIRPDKQAFSDEQSSVPSAGVPGWAGASYTVWSATRLGTKKRYATGGNSYVSVVEFGERVRARSLHAFGASSNPGTDHYMDQALRMPSLRYKDAWLYLDDVRKNAVASYYPGE